MKQWRASYSSVRLGKFGPKQVACWNLPTNCSLVTRLLLLTCSWESFVVSAQIGCLENDDRPFGKRSKCHLVLSIRCKPVVSSCNRVDAHDPVHSGTIRMIYCIGVVYTYVRHFSFKRAMRPFKVPARRLESWNGKKVNSWKCSFCVFLCLETLPIGRAVIARVMARNGQYRVQYHFGHPIRSYDLLNKKTSQWEFLINTRRILGR